MSSFFKGNLERLLLYILVSVLFAILCVVIVMSCKLQKEKKRAKKCIKQQQTPIFEYLPEEEDDENNLMSPNVAQQYKLLNQETNNNLLSRNDNNDATRTMVLINNQQQALSNAQLQPSTFYSLNRPSSSPISQVNPNYIHPNSLFLNEQELIENVNEDDDDEPLEGGFMLRPDRQNLRVRAYDLKSFKNLTNNTTTKPILIKNHASTIHLIRCSKPQRPSQIRSATTTALLSSSSFSTLLNRRCNQFINTDKKRSTNDDPMHALILTTTPCSSCSQNTTLTNTATSFFNTSPSQSFSQRATPQSKNRLLNLENSNTDCKTNDSNSNPNSTAASPIPNNDHGHDHSPLPIIVTAEKSITTTTISTAKQPAWLSEPSPIKQNANNHQKALAKDKKIISSVGEHLF